MPMTEEQFIDVDGVRTRYFEQGTGGAAGAVARQPLRHHGCL